MPDHTDRKLEIVTQVPESAMVVFAHPDDAEIGSGGVIARWVAAGCDVTYVLCTNGDAGTADRNLAPVELAQNRAHEQRAAADFMGVRHVEMLGYPDGYLEDTREFLGGIADIGIGPIVIVLVVLGGHLAPGRSTDGRDKTPHQCAHAVGIARGVGG